MLSLLLALALSASAADPKLDAALDSALTYRAGLQRVLDFAEARPNLFPPDKLEKPRLLGRDEKQDVRNSWKSLLDYVLALDSLQRAYGSFWKVRRADRDKALTASYAAFAAQYRFALDFISRVENDPGLHPLLDEAIPDLGLPKGSYARFKSRFLNVGRAAEFAALEALYAGVDDKDKTADAAIRADARRLWEHGKGKGAELTARNGLKILQSAGFTAFFPVQAGVAEWMGDTKVLRQGQSLITPQQIAALKEKLEPGDILLERREWYLSNIGLPGYWPHAALYVGDGQVIEAVSEGVILNTLEHSADADAVVVLRPRLDASRRQEAVKRARELLGRPYDYDFDFRTDSAIVCTELVYKSYEPELRLPFEEILGRLATPANLIARKFDLEYGTPEQQLDFVAFLDGAKDAGVAEFRKSWLRPKWHIVAKELEAVKPL